MSIIRFDLSQYYPMKAIFERVLGKASFMKVKDCGSFSNWKVESIKLLKAIDLSIKATVEVADEEWKAEINTEIQHGILLVKNCNDIDELFASLAATLTKITFLQIGFFPKGHRNAERIALIPQNWKLNPVRSVQYVQSPSQKEAQLRLNLKKHSSH